MSNPYERPVCHRAEDLVTYLYGEASPADSQDFAGHLHQCDACRAEHAIFQSVHESIVEWRNEALGAAVNPVTAPLATPATTTAHQFIQRPRKLSAIAALREFFSVSPFWLRGATGVAALLLCVMVALAVSRLWRQPAQVAKGDNAPKYSQQQLDDEVNKRLSQQATAMKNEATSSTGVTPRGNDQPAKKEGRVQLASNGSLLRARPPKGLTRQEREQLAADLGLIPGRDNDEFPFVFTDEPE